MPIALVLCLFVHLNFTSHIFPVLYQHNCYSLFRHQWQHPVIVPYSFLKVHFSILIANIYLFFSFSFRLALHLQFTSEAIKKLLNYSGSSPTRTITMWHQHMCHTWLKDFSSFFVLFSYSQKSTHEAVSV